MCLPHRLIRFSTIVLCDENISTPNGRNSSVWLAMKTGEAAVNIDVFRCWESKMGGIL
jgi:hypothetical protein